MFAPLMINRVFIDGTKFVSVHNNRLWIISCMPVINFSKYVDSLDTDVRDICSASVLLKATIGCFLDSYKNTAPAIVNAYPV